MDTNRKSIVCRQTNRRKGGKRADEIAEKRCYDNNIEIGTFLFHCFIPLKDAEGGAEMCRLLAFKNK